MTAKQSSIVSILILVFFISLVFWPYKCAPRIFLNQLSATRSVETISLSQREYAARHPQSGYACILSDLAEQNSGGGTLDSVLAAGTKSGYNFEIQCPQDKSRRIEHYAIVGAPVKPGITGQYVLCGDQNGEIWYSENGSAPDCLARHKPVESKYRKK